MARSISTTSANQIRAARARCWASKTLPVWSDLLTSVIPNRLARSFGTRKRTLKTEPRRSKWGDSFMPRFVDQNVDQPLAKCERLER